MSLHVDIGGEGRHSDAVNLNPSTLTSTTGEPNRPIPNLVRGRGEQMPFRSGSADLITVENAPLRPLIIAEIARVVKTGGEIRLLHPAAYANNAHPRVISAVGGAVIRQYTDNSGMRTTIIAVRE